MAQVSSSRRAIIIGAGPGGLTAAIALRRAGLDAFVYERAGVLREVGSGLTLWPNALKALALLGLDGAVRAVSLPMAGIAMRRWDGEPLFDVSQGHDQPPGDLDASGVALSRAELLSVLLRDLGNGAVTLGARCVGFRQNAAGVTAFFADGSQAHGDLLLGADGLNSAIRTQLFGAEKPRFAGYCVWRGVTHFELKETCGLTSMGRGAQFGLFPMTKGRVYWFASANAHEGDGDWSVGRKRELLLRFGAWHEPVASVIEATPESAILRNDIYDREPLDHWGRGRVTLLGDSAHPSTPDLGQGACQAIEDAVVLAKCVADEGQEVAEALKTYESRRVGRTGAMTRQARRLSRLGRLQNPVACWLRDRAIKRTPNRLRVWQLEWLFRFEV